MNRVQQLVSALLEADEDDIRDMILRHPIEDDPAQQIDGDFGDPWTYGGAWKKPLDDTIWYIAGLEGEDIKDVEPWDIEVPPEVEAKFVQQVLPGSPYRTVKEVGDVMDPEDPGRYLYRDEEREIDQLLDEWKTEKAAQANADVKLPVYRFDSTIESWMDMEPVRAQLDEDTWARMDDAAKVLEWGRYHGFLELDPHPDKFTKEELKKTLNLDDL